MDSSSIHPNDLDLSQAVRGQLPPAQMRALAAHLAGCASCRARMYRAEQHWHDSPPPIHRVEPAAAVAAAPQPARSSMARIAAAAGLLAGSASVYWTLATGPTTQLQAASLPDPALTPGMVLAMDAQRLCARPTGERLPHSIGPALARAVFQKYRIGRPTSGAYEVDYLITPDLGGAHDVRNLWPQPYDNGVWNARVKDALEDRLRELVCAGKLDLQTAQRELATDWIAAYRRHFGRQEPLAEHRRFVKDQPWHE